MVYILFIFCLFLVKSWFLVLGFVLSEIYVFILLKNKIWVIKGLFCVGEVVERVLGFVEFIWEDVWLVRGYFYYVCDKCM